MEKTETPLAHHTFAPWKVDGDRRIVAAEREWDNPLMWSVEATFTGERRRVLVSVDVFEDWEGRITNRVGNTVHGDQAEEWGGHVSGPIAMQDIRDRLFALIDSTPHLDWLIVTSRPENVEIMMACRAIGEHHLDRCDGGRVQSPNAQFTRDCTACKGTGVSNRKNLWLGVRVSNQAEADERIPQLLRVPAAVRFVMCELTGAVDLTSYNVGKPYAEWHDWLNGVLERPGTYRLSGEKLDWVIVSGESGPDARPMHPDWVRGVRDQCVAAGVPFWFDVNHQYEWSKSWSNTLPDRSV